jgi:hypothetical protein
MEPEHALRRLLEVGTAVKVAEQKGARGELPPFLPDYYQEEDLAPLSAQAALDQPSIDAPENHLFVDTAFLTDGGARSFSPFARPTAFAQHHP